MLNNDIVHDIIISLPKTEFFYKENFDSSFIFDDIITIVNKLHQKSERIRQLVTSLTKRLSGSAEINFARVEVMNSPWFVSCLGDTIFVSTRVAELIEDDIDVWAAVLSHEIAHMENHLFRGYTSSQTNNHAEEYRADSRGLAIMTLAGFNPQGMIRLFELIRKVDGDAESLTHPSLSKRVERIRTQLESYNRIVAKNSSLSFSFNHAYA